MCVRRSDLEPVYGLCLSLALSVPLSRSIGLSHCAAHVRLVDISINISITALWVRRYVRGCTTQGKGAGVTLRGNVTLIYDLHVCVCDCVCVRARVCVSFALSCIPFSLRLSHALLLLALFLFLLLFCFTFKLSLASLAVLSQFIFSSALTLSLNARSVALSHALSLTLSLALALSLCSLPSPTALRSCSHFLFQLLLLLRLLPRRG